MRTQLTAYTCQGAGAAVGPAGPTVLRDVLVAGGAGVVDAVDVPPVPALRELGHVQVLVRPGVGSVRRQKEKFWLPASSGRLGECSGKLKEFKDKKKKNTRRRRKSEQRSTQHFVTRRARSAGHVTAGAVPTFSLSLVTAAARAAGRSRPPGAAGSGLPGAAPRPRTDDTRLAKLSSAAARRLREDRGSSGSPQPGGGPRETGELTSAPAPCAGPACSSAALP